MKTTLLRGLVGFFSLVICLAVTDTGYAGWGAKWKKNGLSAFSINEPDIKKAETADISQASVEIMSAVPKLFWVDCGLEDMNENEICASGTLRYVDPAETSPVVRAFDTGVTVRYDDEKRHTINAANINLTTYQMTNLKVAYVFYFKGGKIWKVDTTTLTKTQVSSEAGATAVKLCEVDEMEDWDNTENSTIAYRLAGTDGFCFSSDDIRRAVKLNMSAATPPVAAKPLALLFDDTYISLSLSAMNIVRCQPNLTTCSNIAPFTTVVWTPEYDASRVTMMIDGRLAIYNYSTNILTTLYTPLAGEQISESALDRDGYVYFAVTKNISPFTNFIRRMSVTGGAVTTLASFETAYPLPLYFLDLELSPTRLTYYYPNASFSAMSMRSIPKSGGTPVVISDAAIAGGAPGDYAIIETTAGAVQWVKLSDGTRLSRANSQLNGVTLGGSADWHYFVNTSTMRGFLSSIGNQLKSYAYGEDFTVPTNGIVIGTVPVNLNNFWAFAPGNDLLGSAGKRHEWFSFGNDVLFLRAATANSLKRLTNTNGEKLILQGID